MKLERERKRSQNARPSRHGVKSFAQASGAQRTEGELYAAAGAGRTRAAEGNNRQENFSPLKSDGPHFSFREKSWRASKQLMRWEHEDVTERHQALMQNSRGIMRQRGALVEHPFGTLKRRAGWDHFLMRGLKKSKGEFSLMVPGYNFTRVLNILGMGALKDYCVQRSQNKTVILGYA